MLFPAENTRDAAGGVWAFGSGFFSGFHRCSEDEVLFLQRRSPRFPGDGGVVSVYGITAPHLANTVVDRTDGQAHDSPSRAADLLVLYSLLVSPDSCLFQC